MIAWKRSLKDHKTSLTIQSLYFLNRVEFHLSLVLFTLVKVNNSPGQSSGILKDYNRVQLDSTDISSKMKKGDFFILGLFSGCPRGPNNFGKVVFMMPMIYGKFKQYNEYIEPNSDLIIKHKDFYLLNWNMTFYHTTLKKVCANIIYRIQLTLPIKEEFMYFLKNVFVTYHEGQTLMIRFNDIKKNMLRFMIYRTLQGDVEEDLQRSIFISEV